MKYCFQQISFNYTSLDSNKVGTFLFLQTPCQWKQTRTHRVNGNRKLIISSYHFYSFQKFLTLILPHANTKSLAIKAFHYPFHSKVSRFLRAEQHTPRDAFVDSKGLGNLLRINCILLTSLHIQRGAFVEISPTGWTFFNS